MTVAKDAPPTQRLLAGTADAHRVDLIEHIEVHGPLAIPDRREAAAWRAAMLVELRNASLTGRGGGGFPTERKLSAVPATRRRPVLVINAMEGEPAAHKDSVLACFAPHLILDGAEVLARIVDATAVTIAVASDNDPAAASLGRAIAERRSQDASSVELSVVRPPGRYIAGEESALVQWINGNEAWPTFRPHKPASLRVSARPAVIHNAETAAHAALIARHGGSWFASPDGAGTTLVTISGAVGDPGVFEVSLGTRVRDIVELARPHSSPRAALLGGYGGSFIGEDTFDAPYSREGLRPYGATVGAGVIVVFDATSCGIAEMARITTWMARESAGQCGPCVFGLPTLGRELEALASGITTNARRESIAKHLDDIEGRGACAHPDGVVRMVRTGLSVFSDDVNRHAQGHPCGARGARSVVTLPDNGGTLLWK